MKRRSLFINIFPKFAFITALTIVLLIIFNIYRIEHYVIEESNSQLEQAAKTVVQFSNTYFNSLDVEYNQDTLISEVKRKSELFGYRFSLLDATGNIIVDTKVVYDELSNHKNKPEIKDALNGDIGKSVRVSNALKIKMAFVAVPLMRDGKIIGIVRTAKTLSSLEEIVDEMAVSMIIVGIIILLISLWVTYIITKHYTSLLEGLKRGAIAFSEGELEEKLEIPNIDEMAVLAESMNDMAFKLNDRIKTIEKQKIEISARREELIATFRSINDGVVTFDTHGKVKLMNTASEELLEWTYSELENQRIDQYIKFYEESGMTVLHSLIDEFLASDFNEIETEPVVYVSKYQKRYVFELIISPITDDKLEVIGGVLVIKNVTANRDIERELTKLKKLESVGRLAGGIAHDFNNLLSGILGGVNLSLHSIKPTDKAYRHLKVAEKACRRATDLTQKLLTFSKGGEPIKTNSKIDEIVKDSAEFVLHGSNNKLDIHIDKDLWAANVDRGQISQVIQNLVINAVQATRELGEIYISCKNRVIAKDELTLVKEGHYIEIIIKDNGIGMNQIQIEHIFDPYFTTKKDGNGLGLAVTYSIIKKHNGAIFVDSEEGVGTSFTILIPSNNEIIQGDFMEAFGLNSGEKNSKIMTNSNSKEKLVVVMDDEELIRETSVDMLEMLNYQVDTVEDSEALFAKLAAFKVDCVILDLTIPGGKGGKEIIDDIKLQYPSVKAIVSSGYSSDPIMSKYLEYGFDGVVKKPYSVEELSEELSRILS